MTNEKHTPGPYETQGRAVIAEGAENPCCILMATDGNDHPDPHYHANLSDDMQEANAAFAARACNNHDDLLVALAEIKQTVALLQPATETDSLHKQRIYDLADAAIAKAGQ